MSDTAKSCLRIRLPDRTLPMSSNAGQAKKVKVYLRISSFRTLPSLIVVKFELPHQTFTKSTDLDIEMDDDQAELIESDTVKQAEQAFKKPLFKV